MSKKAKKHISARVARKKLEILEHAGISINAFINETFNTLSAVPIFPDDSDRKRKQKIKFITELAMLQAKERKLSQLLKITEENLEETIQKIPTLYGIDGREYIEALEFTELYSSEPKDWGQILKFLKRTHPNFQYFDNNKELKDLAARVSDVYPSWIRTFEKQHGKEAIAIKYCRKTGEYLEAEIEAINEEIEKLRRQGLQLITASQIRKIVSSMI